MIKSRRIEKGAILVLVALVLSTVSVNAQTAGKPSTAADVSTTLESASRRAKAFVEMVAKSSALTEKKMFKDFRFGSCQPPLFAAPNIGVPARSQPALSLCQP